MALDSAANRFSMLNLGRPPVVPMIIPDGTIAEADRAHFLNLYAGISLSAVSAPVFAGELGDIYVNKNTGTYQFDYADQFSGSVDSYSISPAVETGWTFNTSTGVLTIDTDADGVFGNYTVTATNVSGSANANPFKVHIAASSGGAYRRGETLKPLSYYEDKVKALLAKEKEEIEEKLKSEEMQLEKAEIQMESDEKAQKLEALIADEIRILFIKAEIIRLNEEMERIALNNAEMTRLAEILQDDDEVIYLFSKIRWF